MATNKGIYAAMMKIEAAGLNAPFGWRVQSGESDADAAERRVPIVSTWADGLAAHSDDAVLSAVAAYIKRPTSAWPSVGDIVGIIEGSAHSGDAAAAFGRLRDLARLHGRDDPPLRPGDPGPWALHDHPQIARWLYRATAPIGWRALCEEPDGHRDAWVVNLTASVAASCTQAGKLAQEPAGPRRAAGLRVLALAETVDPVDLWRHVMTTIAQHGPSSPPVEVVTAWRLDVDPETEARMYAGLAAIGGWAAFVSLPLADPDDGAKTLAATRRAFCDAYAATQHHQRRIGVDVGRMLEDRRNGLRLIGGGA